MQVEAVENHMPEIIMVDEIGTEAEALACRTIAERGVQLVATAHGQLLENLIKNPTLSDLVGGIQSVTLGALLNAPLKPLNHLEILPAHARRICTPQTSCSARSHMFTQQTNKTVVNQNGLNAISDREAYPAHCPILWCVTFQVMRRHAIEVHRKVCLSAKRLRPFPC